MRSIVLLFLSLVGFGSFTPDREFSEIYYQYFENSTEDGICDFKLPVKVVSTEKLDSLNVFKSRWPYVYQEYGQFFHAFYDSERKKYMSLELPFESRNTVEPIYIFNKEDVLEKTSGFVFSGYTNIYGSGGGMRFGGTVFYSFAHGEDSISVHLKLRDYVSDESFGRHGSKRYFHKYKRPIFTENGNVYILPIDSNQLNLIYNGKNSISDVRAGVYRYENNRMQWTKSIVIE